MKFLLIGVLISYCFIDAICDNIPQNRLIQSYENDTTVNITFVSRRALSVIAQPKSVPNFEGKKRSELLSVAKISRSPRGMGGCSGSYIKSDAEDKFVLTAAHCVYNKISRSWKGSVGDYRIEFGLTNAWVRRTHGIVECTVSDIIANREFTIEPPSKRYATDYAILKLGGCTGNGPKAEPFQLGPFRQHTQYSRAGYGKGRVLRRCKMTRVPALTSATAKNLDAERRTYMNKALITTGRTKGGDSGGPYYLRKKSGAPLVLVAVCRGYIPAKIKPLGKSISIAAKLTPTVVTEIKNWMAGNLGTSGVSILQQGAAGHTAHFGISNLIQRYIYANKAYGDDDNVAYYDDDDDDDDDDDIESF